MAKVTAHPAARTIIHLVALARRWGAKAGFAVTDQGLFAGTNFLMNILLARWLSPAEYGAFTVAYSVFVLLIALHTAILIEPMLVFGAGKYTAQFRKYLGFLLYGHAVLTGVTSFILAMAVLLFREFGSARLTYAFLGLAIAPPFILLLWILRRAFYVRFQPQWAAAGGALYLLLMTTGLYGLYRVHWISSFAALTLMGVASMIVGLWLIRHLRPQWRLTGGNPTLRLALSDHWAYGKWSTGATALVWVPSNIYYALLPAWVGLEGSAALRALINVIMPINHATSAISVLFVPEYVKAFKDGGKARLRHFVCASLLVFGVVSAFYWGFLIMFRREVLIWFYGGRYGEYADLLIFVGLLPFSAGVVAVLANALRAIVRPDQIFWSYLGSSLVALTLGIWLLAIRGTAGAVTGLLASSVATAVAMICFYVQHNHQIKAEAQ